MKKYILSALALVAIAFTSCENDPASTAYGEGMLDLSAISATIEESTRATSTDNFLVNITSSRGENVGSWTIATLPAHIMLREGDYILEVASAESHAAVAREGYFSGYREFNITSGQTTTVETIICPLESLKVSVEFEGEITEAMSDDCGTTVALDEASLRVTKDDSAPIYFRPTGEQNTLSVVFEGTVDGAAERFETEIPGVRLGQWRHIIIKMTYEDGVRVFSAGIAPWIEDDDIVVE